MNQVEHVADLARLHLSREELERLRTQLSRILAYMEELNAVDTTGIPGTTSVAQGHALRNAPDAVDGLFQVPHIISEQ